MEVTEHYGDFPPDWQCAEIEALMALVKGEMIKKDNDKFTQMFYAKMYGKLMAMKHEVL